MTKRADKPPHNPVVRYLAVAAILTMGVVGVSAVFGLDSVMDWTLIPLALTCAVLVIVYTGWALALGWIASIGHIGQVYHSQRSREPVMFWLLVVLYLGLAGPTTLYLITRLLA